MMSINDFSKKQIVVFSPVRGDKISYRNDNLIIQDEDGKVKFQGTCYRIFMLLVVGDTTITTGIIRRAQRFGFSIVFMTYGFRLFGVFQSGLQGNTYLHQKQYFYEGNDLGTHIIRNKICNQVAALRSVRKKTPYIEEGVLLLDAYLNQLSQGKIERDILLGIEGNASRVYFPRIFSNVRWETRRPRVKIDYINCLLDIGYTVLFNFVDAVLQVFGFDVYKGVLHTDFYMRKSLVCDIMEPFRPIVDWRVRKGISLRQFKQDDFVKIKDQWNLEYKKSSSYTSVFMKDILEYKEAVFLYIRDYYRCFMKGKQADGFPTFDWTTNSVFCVDEEHSCNS